MAIQRPRANPYEYLVDLTLLWAIRAGLIALLVTPVIVSPSTVFPFVVGKALFARTVIEIVLALWLILLIRRPEYRPVASTLAILFGLFLLGALISGLFGVSPQRSIWSNYQRMTGVFDLAHWFAALVIMMTVIKGSLQWRIYLSVLLGITIFIGFLGVLEANQATWSAFPWLRGLHGSRLGISLGNATYVGAFGMVTTLIAFGLFADLVWRPKKAVEQAEGEPRRGGRRRRWAALAYGAQSAISPATLALALFYLGAAASGAFLMAGSGSRGAFFGFVLGLGLALAAYAIWGAQRGLRLASGVGIVLLIVAVLGFITLRGSALSGLSGVAPIFDRTVGDKAGGRLLANSPRSVGTRAALEAFADRPIVGWGYENFATVWNRNVDIGDFGGPIPQFDLAHNKPAEILATTGIIGFVPYAGLWFWALWLAIRKVRAKTETQMIDLFVTAGIFAFLGHLLFLFDTTSTFLLLIMMMAFVAAGEARVAARAGQHLPGDQLAPSGGPAGPVTEPAGRSGRGQRPPLPADSAARRPYWRYMWTRVFAPILIATVLVLSLLVTQLQPWRAARSVIQPGTRDELIADLKIFPQLSTIPRIEFLFAMANEFDQLEDPADREDLIDATEPEALTATEDEPENLKLRLVVVAFYRAAADALPERRAEFMEKARQHTDKAIEIGPHIFDSLRNDVEQAFAEGDLATIEVAVTRWREAGWVAFNRQLFDARLQEARAVAQ